MPVPVLPRSRSRRQRPPTTACPSARSAPMSASSARRSAKSSPTDSHNNVIVDVGNAPKNARGNVEYSFDFYILKPVDMTKSSRKMMYEPPNRGGKQYAAFNRSTGGNDPATSTNPNSTFLAPRGYTMVWSGWDFGAGTDNSDFNTTITLPVAHNPDGSTITGPAYEYIVLGNGATTTYTLTSTRPLPPTRPRRHSPRASTWMTCRPRLPRRAGPTRMPPTRPSSSPRAPSTRTISTSSRTRRRIRP